MGFKKIFLLAISFYILHSSQCEEAEYGWIPKLPGFPKLPKIPSIKDIIKEVAGKAVNGSSKAFQDPLTRALCHLRTDELIKYYGYDAEVHSVTTGDGYTLTIFRCNSKNKNRSYRQPVVLQHSLLASSDEFCEQTQGLAYYMADAGYDVWLPNARGNVYSRNHLTLNPNKTKSGFWNFSWDDIGLLDYPAVFDYIRSKTENSKLNIIAHSQGTSSMLALLAEKPEYNEYVGAVSLMAPIAYLKHTSGLWKWLAKTTPILQMMRNREIMPRSIINDLHGTWCVGYFKKYCEKTIDMFFGSSDEQRNNTMLPTIMCHAPSGGSTNQFLHFFQEMKYGFFGKKMKKTSDPTPSDFRLHQITAPISLHYSLHDLFTSPEDIKILIDKLSYEEKNLHVQVINGTVFNNADFLFGMHAPELVYSDILKFFAKNRSH